MTAERDYRHEQLAAERIRLIHAVETGRHPTMPPESPKQHTRLYRTVQAYSRGIVWAGIGLFCAGVWFGAIWGFVALVTVFTS